jgi:hypothetical protein
MFELALPSGLQVKFRAPNFIDRRSILKEFDKNGGYTSEDLLAVKCLQQVNGKDFDASAYDVTDPIAILHNWSLNDYMYYVEVFLSMFMLDEEARKEASNVAKKLLKGEALTEQKNAPATLRTGKATD